jgi:periplasmic divalent cation tolerance protein
MVFTILYVTHPDMEHAKRIVNHLLNKKMIACANFIPISSAYLWQGEIKEGEEIITLLKTTKDNMKKVEEEIKRIHNYDIPCIIELVAKANSEYEDWIDEETIDY